MVLPPDSFAMRTEGGNMLCGRPHDTSNQAVESVVTGLVSSSLDFSTT